MNYYVNLLIVECCYFLPNLIFFGIDYRLNERFTDLARTTFLKDWKWKFSKYRQLSLYCLFSILFWGRAGHTELIITQSFNESLILLQTEKKIGVENPLPLS